MMCYLHEQLLFEDAQNGNFVMMEDVDLNKFVANAEILASNFTLKGIVNVGCLLERV
jgi:hypothetical protein